MSASGSRPVSVLCSRRLTAAQLAQLQAVSPRLKIEVHEPKTRAELTALLRPDTEVLIGTLVPDALMAAPGLRWLQTRSAGVNHVVGTPIWTGTVAITTGSGVHGITMAEYTLGMMIAFVRDFRGLIDHQQRACWPTSPLANHQRFPGRELRGSTVLVVGYGSIGREIARQCHALGLRILAVKRNASLRADYGFTIGGTGDPAGMLPERIYSPAQLDEALPEADFIVLASASTPATRQLLGAAQFQRMKPGALLINLSRGEVVDQAALISTLQDRRIAGAVLDVFEQEPLPSDSPLWKLDNVIISPHIAGFTPRYDDHWAGLIAENLRRYLAGAPLLNLVDRQQGY